jgi:hypothetical protein
MNYLLAVAALAFLFRDNLMAAFQTANPAIRAAQDAATSAKTAGATPAEQATAAQLAANGATAQSPAARIRQLIGDNTLSAGKLIRFAKANGAPDDQQLLLTVSQWNFYLSQWLQIPGQYLGDDGSALPAGAYVSLLNQWANAGGSTA